MKVLMIGSEAERLMLVKEADLSFDEIRSALQAELVEKYGLDAYESPLYVVVEVYPDYLIARGPNADLFQISYTIGSGTDADGDRPITLGDPVQVETAYMPVQQAAHFVQESETADATVFPVVILEAGWARGTVEGAEGVPHYFTPEVVAQVAEAANGAKFGRHHPKTGFGADEPERVAGWFDNGNVSGTKATANLHILESETDMRARLDAARKAGKLNLFGLSVLGLFGFKASLIEGRKALVSTKLAKLYSVDLCAEAGAGGRFLVAASANVNAEISALQKKAVKVSQSGGAEGAGRNLGGAMKDRILKVLEALRKLNAGRATELQKQFDALKEDQHADFLVTVTEAASEVAQQASKDNAAAQTATEVLTLAKESLHEAKLMKSANLIEAKLTESKLPAPAMRVVREHLANQVVNDERVDAEIKLVRECFAAYSTIGHVGSTGVMRETVDKVQSACDAMLGVKEAIADKNVKPFRGLKDMYAFVTGDSDFSQVGRGGLWKVRQAAIATGDFPNILLNSMTKKLLQDWAEVGMNGLDRLVTTGPPIGDYKTQDRVREGYFGDLATVAENGPYVEIAHPTDEKISYAVSKKGNLLTISEETIRNDDLGAIQRFPSRLARAGRRTLKAYITAFFTGNPNFDVDTTAWFHANHYNLSANALSVDELVAREIALMKQTEKDSAKPLGFPLTWIMVPPDLKAVAYKINAAEQYNPGPGIFEPNPFYRRFGDPQNPSGIIVNELLADTNDWYYGTDANTAPFLEMGYLDGIQEPQIFLANLPTQGTMFSNDDIQYKVKMVFGGDIIDYRGVGKNVVA